ncbi:hypothetical protein A2V71_03110 [Candidatus Berkelbacteria bacterium RBG_13_40_8]|uniref:HNH nuclease domain-containing protein n=1 Tax=Candidatus Berkelbacteria bacterium RBG_13_40_8 TaxID=1797467 RepID=A0A1F5DP84_9BACT|nr:MAG: hypothetical protein A2V71_03110 [Candidatus Berkelbacteria bacterium RBG_13_40_8]
MPYVKCKICKKDFYAKPRHLKIGWSKYCSISCRTKSQFKGIYLKCDYCGKSIYRSPGELKQSSSKKYFCNRSCHCAWENKNKRNSENSPNWNGGETIYRAIMDRTEVKKECVKCKIKDERLLVVHHKDRNRKNNGIDNLEYLCRNCHYLMHFY